MATPPLTDTEAPPRSLRGPVLWCVVLLAACCVFVLLGNWQVERRAWKLDLIERVTTRVDAPPVDAPTVSQWSLINADNDEYRHVQLHGTYLPDHDTLVLAATDLGSGYWVLTPFQRDDGTLVLVNRGFVPPAQRAAAPALPGLPEGPVTVTGLLRLSELGGGFLRNNDPAADRWYARDVAAIAEARHLQNVSPHIAPYFIDAGAATAERPADAPVPGLTVVSFHNSHLVYTITWYALALMSLGAAVFIARDEFRRRRRS